MIYDKTRQKEKINAKKTVHKYVHKIAVYLFATYFAGDFLVQPTFLLNSYFNNMELYRLLTQLKTITFQQDISFNF